MNANPKKILLVEDNPLVLSIYRTWLQRHGFKVEGAGDGELALKKLPQFLPDLVVLDCLLPKLNGLEVLKFIRAHPALKKTPVIVLSNSFLEEPALKALNPGVDKQLLKTVCTPKILIQSVRELLALVPPPGWQSAGYPLPADTEEAVSRRPRGCVDGRCCRKYFGQIREASLTFAKQAGSPAGADCLENLYQQVRFMSARAGLEGCAVIAHLASALEAMLFEIRLRQSPLPLSVRQTISQSVDCLGRLFETGNLNPAPAHTAAKVLIVEDNPICNLAALAAMKRAKLAAVSTHDPQAALGMARRQRYDVFLLDIDLPGRTGLEVCQQLRRLPQYQKTPVIFVTSCSEFQSRAQAILSGGNDLIAKPVWPQELALKTIMRLTESFAQPADKPSPQVTVRPAVAPTLAMDVEKIASPRHEKLVMAKLGPLGTTPNANAVEVPGRRADPQLAPHPHSPADTETSARSRIPSQAASPNRLGSAGAGGMHENPAGNRERANLFDKTTREIARIEAAPVNQIDPADKQQKPVADGKGDESLDKINREIARILFGEDRLTGMALHLTRIALDSCRISEILQQTASTDAGNPGAGVVCDQDERFLQITREVARVVFGDEDLSDTHLRLTRIMLERCRVPDIIHPRPTPSDRRNVVKSAAAGSESIPDGTEDIPASLTPRLKTIHPPRLNETGDDASQAGAARHLRSRGNLKIGAVAHGGHRKD